MYEGPPNDKELQEFFQGDGRKKQPLICSTLISWFCPQTLLLNNLYIHSFLCSSIHPFIYSFIYSILFFSVVELPEHHFLLLGNELLLFQGWLYFSPQMPHCIQAWITAKLLLYQYLNCHLEFKKNGHINVIEMSSQEKIFTIHKMHG